MTAVRQVAVEAAGIALRFSTSTDLQYIVLSGLFDPQEDVAIAALRAIRETSRLRKQSYGRSVRAEVVWAAAALSSRSAAANDLVAEGLHDRSWIVRDSAQKALEGGLHKGD